MHSPMLSPQVEVLVLVMLMWPPTVFLHECGHALPALLLTRGGVHMNVGAKSTGLRLRAGRLRMTLRPWSSSGNVGGWVEHQNTRVIWLTAITAGGPLFSFLGAVASWMLIQRCAPHGFAWLLFAAFGWQCAMQAVFSLLPSRKSPSDGARLVWLWRYARNWRRPPQDPNAATSVPPPSAEAGG